MENLKNIYLYDINREKPALGKIQGTLSNLYSLPTLYFLDRAIPFVDDENIHLVFCEKEMAEEALLSIRDIKHDDQTLAQMNAEIPKQVSNFIHILQNRIA